MQGLDSIGEQMHALLREKNSARDKALEQSRTLIRYASLAIRAVHREERDVAAENIRLAKAQAAELEKGLAKYPDLHYAGYTQDALKELAEASIVFALVGDLPLPGASELGVEAAAYLNGLGEAAGELRRWSLDLLRRGKTADAERVLAMMDDIYSLLVTLDYPDALTGGLRRTTDMVRGVTERTRGDLTLSLRMEAAERAAAALEQTLKKFEQYRAKGFVRAKQRLTDEIWVKSIFHPDQDRFTGHIFGAIWQAVALLKAQAHKNFGLKRKDKRDLQTDQLLFSKVFNYVNQVLNVLQPELYLRPEQPMGLALANCQEKGVLVPSFVVGSDLLQGRPEKELAFAIARQLTFIRPEHYLRLAVPTVSELKVVFLAALKLAQPNMPVPGDAAVIGQYVDAMRRTVAPNVLEQLAMVVQRFVQTKADADINKWTQAVELSAHRAGFVLCNDLETAAKMVSTEPVPVGGMSAKDKIRELVLYSISEEYFSVRQHLGLNIG